MAPAPISSVSKTLPRVKIRHKKTGSENSVAGFTIRSLLPLVTMSGIQFIASTPRSLYLKNRKEVNPGHHQRLKFRYGVRAALGRFCSVSGFRVRSDPNSRS
jgi:hypothetical protein